MGKRLTRVEIDSFREHGFLPGIDVFDEEECDAFRSRVDAFEQARPDAVEWAFDISGRTTSCRSRTSPPRVDWDAVPSVQPREPRG